MKILLVYEVLLSLSTSIRLFIWVVTRNHCHFSRECTFLSLHLLSNLFHLMLLELEVVCFFSSRLFTAGLTVHLFAFDDASHLRSRIHLSRFSPHCLSRLTRLHFTSGFLKNLSSFENEV